MVVDENQTPVEDFDAATLWSSNGVYWDANGKIPQDANDEVFKREGELAVRPVRLARSPSVGLFELDVQGRDRAPVFVVNRARSHGGLRMVDKKDSTHPIRIQLEPLTLVTAEIYCPEVSRTPGWATAHVFPLGCDNISLTQCGTYRGKIALSLPPGEYDINVYSESPDASLSPALKSEQSGIRGLRIRVNGKAPYLDLGVISLELPKNIDGEVVDLASYTGKPPPELNITDARGVARDVKLAEFRGKWVLLEFWATWCGVCVSKSLPELIDFYEEHSHCKEHFEILAICDTTSNQIETIEKLDIECMQLIENAWRGRQLPFPVLVDGNGKTSKTYGIVRRPTSLLIDPEGNLVGEGDLKLLREKLEDITRPAIPSTSR